MRDKPVLFSGPMVRGLLEDRKTQTRRLITPQPELMTIQANTYHVHNRHGGEMLVPEERVGETLLDYLPIQVGDWLWVREAWRTAAEQDAVKPSELHRGVPIYFEADGAMNNSLTLWGRQRVGRYMMKWMSRLTLQVTEVRAMRLQDISEEDAKAEGVFPEFEVSLADFVGGRSLGTGTHIFGYKHLWDQLNGEKAWDANPWVAAYTFRVHRKNVADITVEDADDRTGV